MLKYSLSFNMGCMEVFYGLFFYEKNFLLLVCFLMAGAFWSSAAFSKNNCQIVFDAGSSGTRLYVYEKKQFLD